VLCQLIDGEVHAIEEISLPDSNTYEVCREFARRTQTWLQSSRQAGHPIEVAVYGDATGESRKSAASRTDWQIVREFFARSAGEYTAKFQVPSQNPEIKDRVNCVNAVICNAHGQRRLRVAPRCKQLIRDLEQVVWRTDSNGNAVVDLDRSDPMRTHTSDALGYLIAREFSMRPKAGLRPYYVA
jgi:hypothetical protein